MRPQDIPVRALTGGPKHATLVAAKYSIPSAKYTMLRKYFSSVFLLMRTCLHNDRCALGCGVCDDEIFSEVQSKDLKRQRWDQVPLYTNNELLTETFARPIFESRSLEISFR
jgi:hypothetical protein